MLEDIWVTLSELDNVTFSFKQLDENYVASECCLSPLHLGPQGTGAACPCQASRPSGVQNQYPTGVSKLTFGVSPFSLTFCPGAVLL